jgi:hypothetical protein
MDSRATLREIFFRVKLTIVIAIIAALVGAILYLLYITADYNFDLQRYLWVIEQIFTDDKYIAIRRDMLLSAFLSTLLATLPITYIYTR